MAETFQVSVKKKNYTIHICANDVTDVTDVTNTIVIHLAMSRTIPKLTDLYYPILKTSLRADFSIVEVEIEDWNRELSPWEFIEPKGKMSFAGEGRQLLLDLEQVIIPWLCKQLRVKQNQVSFIIAGHSLAGLFSLWALHQTKLFQAAVSCSGSLWYPGFLEYALEHELKEDCDIYLSLGKREAKVRKPYLSKIGEVTQELYEKYQTDARVKHTVLEWTKGGHFQDPLEKIIDGVACVLKWQKKK